MILSTLTLLAGAMLAQLQPVNVCDSAIVQQTRGAITQLRGSPQARLAEGVRTVVYEGTVAVEAHLAQPHQLRTTPVRLEIAFGGGRIAIRETAAGRPESTETTLIVGGRVATQASPGERFKEVVGTDAVEIARRWLPQTVVAGALEAASTIRSGAGVDWRGGVLTPVSFVTPGAAACTLLLDAQGRVARVESLRSDQRLGDVCEWTAFGYAADSKMRGDLPARLDRFMVAGLVTVTYSLSLSDEDSGKSEAVFDLPATSKQDISSWAVTPERPPMNVTIQPVADGLFVAEVPAANERVMVIERERDLVVLEAPDGDATCGELLRALGARFPGKKVGVVAFGHHHPSYTGGLRVFAAQGAAIPTPRETEGFVRLILGRETTLGGPAVAAPAGAVVVAYDGEHTIEAGENTVRLMDIGKLSNHTDRYTVFYFPQRRLLFEGDLGYFPVEGAARVNPRLVGLVEAVERLGLAPERLIQAWPLKGTRQEVAWETAVGLVKAERERVGGR